MAVGPSDISFTASAALRRLPPLPREHGAWAMLLTPLVVAAAACGPDPKGLTAALGWIAGYCLRGPIELLRGTGATGRAGMARGSRQEAKLWCGLFLLGAAALLGPIIWFQPAVLVPLLAALFVLAIVQWMADRGHVKSILSETLSIAGMTAGVPLYYLAATGAVGPEGWVVGLSCFAFFFGSIFRVKSLGRERRSVFFRRLSVAVHLALTLVAAGAAIWLGQSILLPAALLVPTIWAVRCSLARKSINLRHVGHSEVALTAIFGVLLVLAVGL